MSKDIIAVSIVHYICPICGKETDNAIIMNKMLTEKSAKEVRDLNNKIVGYTENACEECAKYKDDVVYVIEIDCEKSKNNNPYRTGNYWGLCKDFALFVEHPEYVLKTKDGVQFCFIDKEVTFKMGLHYEYN